jgi:hypothetical protein
VSNLVDDAEARLTTKLAGHLALAVGGEVSEVLLNLAPYSPLPPVEAQSHGGVLTSRACSAYDVLVMASQGGVLGTDRSGLGWSFGTDDKRLAGDSWERARSHNEGLFARESIWDRCDGDRCGPGAARS